MSTYGTYRIAEKKCATCSYWCGNRRIDFRSNKPFYIQAEAGNYVCMAYVNRKTTAATKCLRWRLWEKIP